MKATLIKAIFNNVGFGLKYKMLKTSTRQKKKITCLVCKDRNKIVMLFFLIKKIRFYSRKYIVNLESVLFFIKSSWHFTLFFFLNNLKYHDFDLKLKQILIEHCF